MKNDISTLQLRSTRTGDERVVPDYYFLIISFKKLYRIARTSGWPWSFSHKVCASRWRSVRKLPPESIPVPYCRSSSVNVFFSFLCHRIFLPLPWAKQYKMGFLWTSIGHNGWKGRFGKYRVTQTSIWQTSRRQIKFSPSCSGGWKHRVDNLGSVFASRSSSVRWVSRF